MGKLCKPPNTVTVIVIFVVVAVVQIWIIRHAHQTVYSNQLSISTTKPADRCIPSTHTESWPTAEAVRRWYNPPPKKVPFVAIVVCVTAKKTTDPQYDEMALSVLMLPSLLQTAEPHAYHYELFVGIDHDDVFWANPDHQHAILSQALTMPVHVHAFSTPDNHIPMNEILVEAEQAGADYLVRINDDTEFITPNWTTYGVDALAAFDPPNVGVVGPTCKQGNLAILTHDMVHRTHLVIFRREYYPEVFGNWWLDDWISRVYGPERTVKLTDWEVVHHTCHHGTRYSVIKPPEGVDNTLYRELKKGTHLVNKWLWDTLRHEPPKSKMLVYTVDGTNPRHVDGIAANAQLHHTVYPGWNMRVYYDSSLPSNAKRVLRNNGVDLVDMSRSSVPKHAWRLFAALDTSIGWFCSRNADTRLSSREKLAVDAWVASGREFHMMRDHPSHSAHDMLEGMWCALHDGFPDVTHNLLTHPAHNFDINTFLHNEIWPIAQSSVLQHDSFTCSKFGGGVPFPSPRVEWEYVGAVYVDNQPQQGDIDTLQAVAQPKECTTASLAADRAPWNAVNST